MNITVSMVLAALLLQLIPQANAQANEGVPALKVRAPNGETSILIGSMHIPYENLRQPSPAVFDGAKYLVVEHLTTEASQRPVNSKQPMSAPGVLETPIRGKIERAQWARFLTEAQVDQLRQNFKCGMTVPLPSNFMDAILSLNSPALAATIAYMPCSQPGSLSRDDILGRAATDRGIRTAGLEAPTAIQTKRDAIPDRIYAGLLHSAFKTDVRKQLSKTVDALNTGDYLAISTILAGTYETPSDAATYDRIMVKERNQAWIPVLRPYLDARHAVIVVGAAHLAGKDGLIALLVKAGYAVEPVALPTNPP